MANQDYFFTPNDIIIRLPDKSSYLKIIFLISQPKLVEVFEMFLNFTQALSV